LSPSLKELSGSNQVSLERVRTTLDASVRAFQDGNEKKLEEMRKTVHEKLHITLEKRLGESFKLVSDQLESVQKGLGEMQSLATGVGRLGDREATQRATEALARAIRLEAQDIRRKYVKPPHTTDFAVMFLATEGLYAEVVRQPALVDELQQRYRVVVAGPTTLAALLSSLRMGFQTLAIEQQAVEVWRVLGAVKTEFSRFGGVLAKVKRQLDTASRTIDQTSVRTRAMERKLRAVEQLPDDEAELVLDLAPPADEPEPEGPLAVPEEGDETTS